MDNDIGYQEFVNGLFDSYTGVVDSSQWDMVGKSLWYHRRGRMGRLDILRVNFDEFKVRAEYVDSGIRTPKSKQEVEFFGDKLEEASANWDYEIHPPIEPEYSSIDTVSDIPNNLIYVSDKDTLDTARAVDFFTAGFSTDDPERYFNFWE